MSPWDRDAWWAGLSYYERLAVHDRNDRYIKRAMAYLKGAGDRLDVVPGPIAVGYWNLLEQAIDTATDIVEALSDDYFESTEGTDFFNLKESLREALAEYADDWSNKFNSSDAPLEAAEKLVATLVERRERTKRLQLITRLEDHTGRTPAEAASFQAKADELRTKLGG